MDLPSKLNRYHIRITDNNATNSHIESTDFSIKPKVPIFVKVGIPAIVGGVALISAYIYLEYMLMTGSL